MTIISFLLLMLVVLEDPNVFKEESAVESEHRNKSDI